MILSPVQGSFCGNQIAYHAGMTFKKGQRGWNKGNRIKGEWRNCLRCGKERWFIKYRLDHGGGKFCSRLCMLRTRGEMRGPEHWNYKGSMTYGAIHDWLRDNFGSATKCENCGSTKRVQWSLLTGKSYERIRENFWQLCTLCHIEYDKTSLKYRPTWNKGRKWSEEEKARISAGTKRGMARWRKKNLC